MRKIVLASASPRRRALLKQIGLRFVVDPSNYDEKIDSPEILSLHKAQEVVKRHKDALIIAADTLVVYKDKILGKPKTAQSAKAMLRLLSGKMHIVITGFAVLDTKNGQCVTKSVETKVFMKKLSSREINSYVATGEPLDKAGGYGIQEQGSIFVRKIEGDFFNVVGLPLSALAEVLKKFGITLPR